MLPYYIVLYDTNCVFHRGRGAREKKRRDVSLIRTLFGVIKYNPTQALPYPLAVAFFRREVLRRVVAILVLVWRNVHGVFKLLQPA